MQSPWCVEACSQDQSSQGVLSCHSLVNEGLQAGGATAAATAGEGMELQSESSTSSHKPAAGTRVDESHAARTASI